MLHVYVSYLEAGGSPQLALGVWLLCVWMLTISLNCAGVTCLDLL